MLVSPPRTSSGHAGGTTRTMSRGGPPLTTSSGRVHSASSARELDEKASHRSGRSGATAVSAGGGSSSAVVGKTRHIPLENLDEEDDLRRHGKRAKKQHEDPRLARQQPTPAAASKTTSSGNGDASQISKKHKSKGHEKASEVGNCQLQYVRCLTLILLLCSFGRALKSRARNGRSGIRRPKSRRIRRAVRESRFRRLRRPPG